MKDIFTQAANVISWLGEPESKEVEVQICALNSFVESLIPCTIDDQGDNSGWHLRMDSFEAVQRVVKDILPGLWGFFRNPYWGRIWVVEECTLPKQLLTLMYSTHTFHPKILAIGWSTIHVGN
ncbi:hypothetical protein BDV96DRAFT_639590 [Lophiotrema nucula]|uniref:Uncharacterized protein n=1 Tax=Lophiotrema nucula TaxID=690887 RepID=A0A6A5ZXL0_9PLEO|nr:hypothetical protein BDV96DRAFT_639590 [Lophiotrema nucula]